MLKVIPRIKWERRYFNIFFLSKWKESLPRRHVPLRQLALIRAIATPLPFLLTVTTYRVTSDHVARRKQLARGGRYSAPVAKGSDDLAPQRENGTVYPDNISLGQNTRHSESDMTTYA